MDFGAPPPAQANERREGEREAVVCHVVLHTSYARMRGTLSDLATGGARFEAELVPRAGITALLEWEGRDTLCRVAWSKEGECGLAFERPISAYLVMEIAERAGINDPEVSRSRRAGAGAGGALRSVA